LRWIDTHCHLDAAEFAGQSQRERTLAAERGVEHCVIPAVNVASFDSVRTLAHACGDSYCLGIHPLYVAQAQRSDLDALDAELTLRRSDPRLVAVGEIGLDFFVAELREGALRAKQEHFYRAQLELARKHDLPVVLHVRRSADMLLKYLRAQDLGKRWRGIAHAFNGSLVQAQAFVSLGFKLGFGGALTFERALQLRRLASQLPLDALVLETDAPDIPPQWLRTAPGVAQVPHVPRNEPGELPRIAQVIAHLRDMTPQALAQATARNATAALPRLAPL